MFEKEGEKYASDLEMIYKKGVLDGYYKCFERIRKIVNEHTRLDCIIPELLRLQEKEPLW